MPTIGAKSVESKVTDLRARRPDGIRQMAQQVLRCPAHEKEAPSQAEPHPCLYPERINNERKDSWRERIAEAQ